MDTQRCGSHLPANLPDELEQFRLRVDQFTAKEIDHTSFHAFRVAHGVYEQRESDTYMLRARLPAGIILPEQMRVLALIAGIHGNGLLHLTSRQDIQLHRLPLAAIYPSLIALAAAGLTTKGSGGNTLRNIAACPHAGICPHEAFDVSPYVLGLTDLLMSDPRAFQLPRKYKIAFSGCGNDCAAATVQDLGFISKVRNQVVGFAVYIGGGMGANSKVGIVLEDFIPTAQMPRIAQAIERVFDQYGNRQNRKRARIRFLLEELGFERFKALYQAEMDQLPIEDFTIPAPLNTHSAAIVPDRQPLAGFASWRTTHVSPQRQPGYFTLEIAPPLGNITADHLSKLANIVDRYGEQMLRVTNWQGALLRWVAEEQLAALHAELVEIGLADHQPALLRHMVSCVGADICRSGICKSHELAQAIHDALTQSGMKYAMDCDHLALHISGCPNACGRHPLAQIGFYGVSRRIGEQSVPHYILQLGGQLQEGHTRLAAGSTATPASNIPAFLLEYLQTFHTASQYPDFTAFLHADGKQVAEEIAQRHLHITNAAKD